MLPFEAPPETPLGLLSAHGKNSGVTGSVCVLANALAHTPQDRPVELTCLGGVGGPAVVVADHGPGLSADSVDVGRNRHGMGLLLVQRLAGQIGAEVRHEPTPGGGLTVTVRVGAR